MYLIRLALGDGVKNPLPLIEFAALIKKRRRVTYDPSAISRMENGERKVTVEDIETIAPLDPKQRGRPWLAGWDDDDLTNPATATKLSEAALDQADADASDEGKPNDRRHRKGK